MSDMITKTGAAYIRVSTDKQEELSPDAQKRLILDYAKNNQITVSPEDIYFENGISGRKASRRPAFQNMIAKAKSKEHPFDVILVWKFSRFARNQEESIVYKSMLQKDHVEVVSISEPVIDGPFGSLIERIIEWMDEYYSIRLSGEVLRGMTEKALRGGYQSVPPYGYTSGENGGPPVINPKEAPAVRHIYTDFLSGKTYNSIARNLNNLGICTSRGNPFEARTVKYILENPFYYGKIRWNYTKGGRELKNPRDWIITDGRHQPLISESEWLAVQERIQKISLPLKHRDIASCRHWLSGILKCSSCGASLGYNSGGGFFQCWKYSKGMCQVSNSITAKKIEANVILGLQSSVLSGSLQYKITAPAAKDDLDELGLLKEQLKKILMKEQRIRDAYENGIDSLDEYKANKIRILEERKKVEDRVNSLTASNNSGDTSHSQKESIQNLQSILSMLSDPNICHEKKGIAIRSVVDKIVYNKEEKHLDFFYYIL